MSSLSFTPCWPQRWPLLLAFDLDGTLLAELGDTVPASSVRAIAELKTLGAKVAIITGRHAVPSAVQEAVAPHAVATNNGGCVEIIGSGHRQRECLFTAEELSAVLTHDLRDAEVVIFTRNGQIYANIPKSKQIAPWLSKRGFEPLERVPMNEVAKATFYHPEVTRHAQRLRQSHPHLVFTGAHEPYPHFLTVTPTGADKATALLSIAEMLEVAPKNTVAFGDSDNDKAMLEIADFSVQVGQLPLLRPLADATVYSGSTALGQYLETWVKRLRE